MRGATERSATWEARSAFQSTLLMRGATAISGREQLNKEFQSTLLMRGATLPHPCDGPLYAISIHAPHARSDCSSSTLSSLVTDISIHAPHARSDGMGCNSFRTYQHFNPRSSCEERLGSLISRLLDVEFQSTLLMRGATPELQRGL